MKDLLYKELKLAVHPTMYIFLTFGAMLLIPAYEYYVVFFYTCLSLFFAFLGGRENNDVTFTTLLPVCKGDVVRARLLLATLYELAALIVSTPFAVIGARINPNASGNVAGIDANVAFFGFVLGMFAVFNLVYFASFYKNVLKPGVALLKSLTVMLIYIAVCESLIYIPSLKWLDATDTASLLRQLPILLAGMVCFVLVNMLTCRVAVRRFERVDL